MLRLAALAALCGAVLGGAEEPKSPQDPKAAGHDHQALFEEFLPKLHRDVGKLHAKISSSGKLQRLSSALARLKKHSKVAPPSGRRLWGWDSVTVDATELENAANDFVEEADDFAVDTYDEGMEFAGEAIDTAGDAAKVVGEFFANIKNRFTSVTGLMDACKEVLDSAWEATTGFKDFMEGIFSNFGTVEHYFDSPFGIIPLLANSEMMKTIFQTIDMVLDSTQQLTRITQAIELVAVPLDKVRNSMKSILEDLTKKVNEVVPFSRRLFLNAVDLDDAVDNFVPDSPLNPDFDYMKMIEDLNLDTIPVIMGDAMGKARNISDRMWTVAELLKPIFDRVKAHYGVGGREIGNLTTTSAPDNDTDQADTETRQLRAIGAQATPEAQLSAQLHRRLMALDALGVGREAGAPAWSQGLDRRLADVLEAEGWDEVEKDKGKYEGAMLSVVEQWQNAEGLAKDTCFHVKQATQKIDTLVCRVETFISQAQLPSEDAVTAIMVQCDKETTNNITKEGDCPAEVQSKNVRTGFAGSAGFISVAFALIEYTISNYKFLGFIMALVVLLVGLVICFLGYYIKATVEFFQGCLGGFVLWSMILSVMVVWFDMCRGGWVASCDPKIMLIVVCVLSVLSGVLTWKLDWERAEAILSGFTTGAFAAGVYYIIIYRDELLHGFLDSEAAKPYMISLAIVMFLVGSIVACLTQVLFRQLLMMGTAIIGSFLIVCSFLMNPITSHWWSVGDWVAWAVLAVLGYGVQLLVTPPDYELKSEEEKAEFRHQLSKEFQSTPN